MSLRDDVLDIRARIRRMRDDMADKAATNPRMTAADHATMGGVLSIISKIEELMTDALEKDREAPPPHS